MASIAAIVCGIIIGHAGNEYYIKTVGKRERLAGLSFALAIILVVAGVVGLITRFFQSLMS